MAACVAACQLQRNRFLVTVFASDAILNRSSGLCGLCGSASDTQARTSCSFLKMRKLARSDNIAVVKLSQCYPLSRATKGVEREPTHSTAANPHTTLENGNHFTGIQYLIDNSVTASCSASTSKRKKDRNKTYSLTLSQRVGGVTLKSITGAKTTSVTGFYSPQIPQRHYFVRHFSSRHGDSDEEEKNPKSLRNAVSVMYIANPITWLTNKWNTANLRRKFDPSFSESEFLLGAKQAISYVTQLVSGGQFDKLKELVVVEAMDWLTSYRKTLSCQEQEALALDADNLAVMKIVLVELDTEKDKKLAYVDLVCIGLKVVDSSVPYMVDMGVRFKRDYSVEPPSSWVLDTVRHIRLNNMTP